MENVVLQNEVAKTGNGLSKLMLFSVWTLPARFSDAGEGYYHLVDINVRKYPLTVHMMALTITTWQTGH